MHWPPRALRSCKLHEQVVIEFVPVTFTTQLPHPRVLIQVSDRRLTWPDGRLADDTANKAILFHGKCCIRYTGIARIGSTPTDEWIMEQVLKCKGIQDVINTLKSALDSQCVDCAIPTGN
jgi:hypothetical protein